MCGQGGADASHGFPRESKDQVGAPLTDGKLLGAVRAQMLKLGFKHLSLSPTWGGHSPLHW